MKSGLYISKEEIVDLRRRLHKDAEVGFNLGKTTEFIKEKLKEYGLIPTDIGKGSVTASIDRGKEKTLLLRADIDAVPIKEKTSLEYSSLGEAMHACGHDMHAAILLYTAKMLKIKEEELNINIKFLFQGGEELLEGASDCINNGLFDAPRPDCALTLHVLTGIPIETGSIIIPRADISAPSADFFEIKLKGKSAHAATPSNAPDVLITLGQLLSTLPLLPRFVSASSEPSLITIGKVRGGTAPNVIAESASLFGTARALTEETRKKLKERVVYHTENICRAYKSECEINFLGGTAPMRNDECLIEKIFDILKDDGNINLINTGNSGKGEFNSVAGGSEDFANISAQVPSVMLALAAGDSREGYTEPLHNPRVRFDEEALASGVYVFVKIALNLK